MRFQTTQQPRGLISRRHQVRLLLMMVALAIVLMGSRVVGQPEFWAGMFPGSQAADNQEGETGRTHTTLRPEFPAAAKVSPVPTLRDDFRRTIEDNVIGVRASETKAWRMSMGLAERITTDQARQLPQASYALLMDAPEDCRGNAWTLTGTLRRMTKEKLTNDSMEYRNVVDAWLTLPGSGDGLVHVVALEASRDLPFAAEFQEDPPHVTVSGYFFKREAYASGADGGLSIAPLLLAAKITRAAETTPTNSRSDRLTSWLGWLAIIVCGALGLVVWSFVTSDAANKGQRTHELTQLPSSPSFEGVDAESPYETLQQLETATDGTPGDLQIDRM